MTDLINGPRCHEAARAIADLPSATPTLPTVAATWRANGEPDPHGNRYDCERAALPKGSLTDDELANAVFMADRNSLDLIVWQTAAKERIRWLSRALAASQSPDLVTNAGSRQPTLDEALALPEIAALVEAALPYISPVQTADFGRQLRQHDALVAALAAITKGNAND